MRAWIAYRTATGGENRTGRNLLATALATTLAAFGTAHAATGEMGVGIPHFGVYSEAAGGYTMVWSIANPSTPFPAGCPNIKLVRATMGADSYKIALATLTTARLTGRPVRFYSHAERDGGCGVDYVELQ